MNMIDAMLQEFTQESATTRRMLERAPMEKHAWSPHPKSMSLGRLVSHIAEIPMFVPAILEKDEWNLEPGEYKPACFETLDALLAGFDKLVEAAKKVMAGQSDDLLMQPWRFNYRGKTVMELPRIAALRVLVISHVIHHRGQLSVYLRLNDAPVPSVYGPTADVPM